MAALSSAAVLALAISCAPEVAPQTMLAVVKTESGLNPYVIGVNGPGGGARSFASAAAATAAAERLIAAGANVDLGLAQLNWKSGHLQRRGLPISAAFEPCTALSVGSQVLAHCWSRATGSDEQSRLYAAVGCYNAGHPRTSTPYVFRVLANAGIATAPTLPAARDTKPPTPPPAPRGHAGATTTVRAARPNPLTADTAVAWGPVNSGWEGE